MQPDVLMKNLKWASDAANVRVANGEINEARARELVSEYAVGLTQHVKIEEIDLNRAWEYAEVFRTARIWNKAKPLFELALAKPVNEDRRVNDSLHLAQALGQLGQVPEAIQRVRTIFDAAPQDRAPIMPALTLEVVPACMGKGHDEELAKLLEEALPLYDATVVDEKTEGGAAFKIAKPYHMRRAVRLIAELRDPKSGGAN